MSSVPEFHSIRARIPLDQAESLVAAAVLSLFNLLWVRLRRLAALTRKVTLRTTRHWREPFPRGWLGCESWSAFR